MTARTLMLSALAIIAILMAAVMFVPAWYRAAPQSSEQRFSRILRQYVENGLCYENILGDATTQYIIGSTFTFSPGQYLPEVLPEFVHENPIEIERISGPDYLKRVINELTAETRFQGKVQINQPPREGYLNIYFLTRDPQRLAKHFNGNCVYIGGQDIILCDANFILKKFAEIETYDDFIVSPAIDSTTGLLTEPSEEEKIAFRNKMKASFFALLLGHEIGHAQLHADYLAGRERPAYSHGIRYDERELEADDFVANALRGSRVLPVDFLLTMNEMFEREYRSHLPERLQRDLASSDESVAGRLSIEVTYSEYDMPIVVRLARVLARVAREIPGIDDTKHYERAQSTILVRERRIVSLPLLIAAGLAALLAVVGQIYVLKQREDGQT